MAGQARNEKGQFLPRNENDTPIAVVLQQSEEKRQAATAEATEDKKEVKKAEGKPSATFTTDEAAAELWEDIFGSPADKPTEEQTKQAEAEKAKKTAAAKKTEDDKKKKTAPPAKVAPRRVAEPMSPEQIAELAAETAARVTGAKKEEPPKKVEPEADPNLTAADQRTLGVLKHMETLHGDKYKNAAQRFQTAQKKLRDYAAKWETDHPGEKFDEDAAEHEKFFEDNDAYEFWDPDDFDEARLDQIAQKREQKRNEEQNREVNLKLDKLERAERLRQELPKVKETQIQAAKLIWKNYGDTYDGLIGDTGWDKAKADELAKADPVGYSHRLAVARDFDREAGEIYKLYNGLVDYDGNNDVHRAVSQFYMRFEAAMLKAPIDIRTNPDGQVFMPSKDYFELPRAKRDKYWTFSADDVIFKRAQVLAKETDATIKADEDRLTKFAEAKGWKKAENNGDRKTGQTENAESEPEDGDEKPGGPSAAATSKVAALKQAAAADARKTEKTFFDDL